MKLKSEAAKGYVLIIIAGSLWGCLGIFMHNMTELGAGSGLVALLRQGFGTLFILPLAIASAGGVKGLRVSGKNLGVLMLMGLLSEALFNICYVSAVARVGVSTAAVLLYTAPVFVAIMSRVMYAEALTGTKIFALALNLLGCALTVTNGDFTGAKLAAGGIIFGVMAGFLYGTVTILGKLAGERVNPYVTCLYTSLFGFLFLILLSRPWTLDFSSINGKIYLWGAGLGLIGTALPYAFYMKGLTKPVEASKVPVVASVETVAAAFWGALLFNEQPGPVKILGIGLVFLSIGLINRSPKKPA